MIRNRALEEDALNIYLREIDAITKSSSIEEMYLCMSKMIHSIDNEQTVQAIFHHIKANVQATKLLRTVCTSSKRFPANLLEEAVKKNNIAFINVFLVEENAAILVQSCSLGTLYELIANQHNDLFLQFLKLGAPYKHPNDLAIAILYERNTDLFNIFLELPAIQLDFNRVNREKRTLLHIATIAGNPDTIDLLLVKGLSPSQKDIYGFTSIDYALFLGNIEIAYKLSGQDKASLEQDPRYKKIPPRVNHEQLVTNILHYLKMKHTSLDPDIQFTLPNIDKGVCNGWAMSAALSAAESDEELHKFYKMIDLFCAWDGELSSLALIPDEFREEFISLDEMFLYLTNELYWFFQQKDASFGVSKHNREKQLELISSKRRIKRLADFGLPDLTLEEQKIVFNAFHSITDETLIDTHSQTHDVSFYQKSSNCLHYFDVNFRYCLPPFEDYQTALDEVYEMMGENVEGIAYFHTNPEKVTSSLQKKADQITAELIQKLILSQSHRYRNLPAILNHAASRGLSHFLAHILTAIGTCPSEIMRLITYTASKSRTFECLHVLYQHHLEMEDLPPPILFDLLHTAIQFDDKDMFIVVKSKLNNALITTNIIPNEQQRALMAFVFPQNQTHKNQKIDIQSPAQTLTPMHQSSQPEHPVEKNEDTNKKFSLTKSSSQ
ncbi:MAG: hypothetical protein BGO43_01870 [Gammaproteobacteria bacterium 39-13]|nr:ankyrin repeat domain-containing protein [Gammaproteobacteria bacterium]OJV91829.1 MAG: hypothetical protein BGO43_01870 [Gammaproteobacteria bacterium 39-13]